MPWQAAVFFQPLLVYHNGRCMYSIHIHMFQISICIYIYKYCVYIHVTCMRSLIIWLRDWFQSRGKSSTNQFASIRLYMYTLSSVQHPVEYRIIRTSLNHFYLLPLLAIAFTFGKPKKALESLTKGRNVSTVFSCLFTNQNT